MHLAPEYNSLQICYSVLVKMETSAVGNKSNTDQIAMSLLILAYFTLHSDMCLAAKCNWVFKVMAIFVKITLLQYETRLMQIWLLWFSHPLLENSRSKDVSQPPTVKYKSHHWYPLFQPASRAAFYPIAIWNSSHTLTKMRNVMIKKTATFWVSELMAAQQIVLLLKRNPPRHRLHTTILNQSSSKA